MLILSSGSATSADVSKDVLRAEAIGEQARADFIELWLKTVQDFFEPVKQLNFKTLSDISKSSDVMATKNKVIQYKWQGNVAFQLFVKSQNHGLQLDL